MQVAARTESVVSKRNQAMPRPSSKRRSRFSSLWGLDTTSKRKTKGRPSINQVWGVTRCVVSPGGSTLSSVADGEGGARERGMQGRERGWGVLFEDCSVAGWGRDVSFVACVWPQVFVDGMETTKKPLERMFEDSASEKSVGSLSLSFMVFTASLGCVF